MTSPIATIALTYNGTNIQDIDGIHLQITAGLTDSPNVRGEDVLVPKADGMTARPRRFNDRRILLEGFVRGNGVTRDAAMADYRANCRTIATLFDATAAPADLIAYLEDGSVATIAARTLDLQPPEDVQSEYATVSVELSAVEEWIIVDAGS